LPSCAAKAADYIGHTFELPQKHLNMEMFTVHVKTYYTMPSSVGSEDDSYEHPLEGAG